VIAVRKNRITIKFGEEEIENAVKRKYKTIFEKNIKQEFKFLFLRGYFYRRYALAKREKGRGGGGRDF